MCGPIRMHQFWTSGPNLLQQRSARKRPGRRAKDGARMCPRAV